jgi:hypothetical protein
MKFHLATTISRWLSRWANFYNARILREIKDAELCPYVEVVPGFGKNSRSLVTHVQSYGGIVFANGSKRKFFWHPNDRFIPITATAIFRADEGWKSPPPTGKLCGLCHLCSAARPQFPDR